MPIPPDDIDAEMWARLARYVAGECPPGEARAVRDWAARDANNASLLAELTHAWDHSRRVPIAFDVERGWRRMAPAVAASRSVRRVPAWMQMTLAAAILLAIAAGARILARPTRYASGVGARRMVTLSDGTHVTLAPDSRLSVPRRYGHGEREVSLQGEAYFAVVHDTRAPFTVRAGGIRTTDIGTAFDIRAYPTDSATRVVVAEGEVAVENVVVRAGQMIALAVRGDTVTPADVGAAMEWTHGRLVVRNVPLRDVLPDLHRWYGLDVVVTERALQERPITASWSDEPPEIVLRELGGLLRARVIHDGQRVRLEPLP